MRANHRQLVALALGTIFLLTVLVVGCATTQTEGTRESPLAVGKTAQVGDWKVTVTKVTRDAATEMAQVSGQQNEPAVAGKQYVLVAYSAEYTGSQSGAFSSDLFDSFVGSGGNSYSETNMSGNTLHQSNPIPPSYIADAGEAFSGAKIAGNTAYEVDRNQVDGGTISVENRADPHDRAFWAIQ